MLCEFGGKSAAALFARMDGYSAMICLGGIQNVVFLKKHIFNNLKSKCAYWVTFLFFYDFQRKNREWLGQLSLRLSAATRSSLSRLLHSFSAASRSLCYSGTWFSSLVFHRLFFVLVANTASIPRWLSDPGENRGRSRYATARKHHRGSPRQPFSLGRSSETVSPIRWENARGCHWS